MNFVSRNSLGFLQSDTLNMEKIHVESKRASNTSDHVKVIATLELVATYTQMDSYTIQCKPKWDKCDQQMYEDCISE